MSFIVILSYFDLAIFKQSSYVQQQHVLGDWKSTCKIFENIIRLALTIKKSSDFCFTIS